MRAWAGNHGKAGERRCAEHGRLGGNEGRRGEDEGLARRGTGYKVAAGGGIGVSKGLRVEKQGRELQLRK